MRAIEYTKFRYDILLYMKKILAIILGLLILLIKPNITYAIDPMPYGGVVIVNSDDACSQTTYAAIEDTDTARGDALLLAMEAIRTGGESMLGISNQSVYLTEGTFDIGENYIDLSEGAIPFILQNNNLHGSGKDSTVIKSAIHGNESRTIVSPSMQSSQITDLTISASYSNPDYQFPFGIGIEPHPFFPGNYTYEYGNVFLKDVKILGNSDGIYFNHDATINMVLNVINTTITAGWDAIAVFDAPGLQMNIYDSSFDVSGITSLTLDNYHGINGTEAESEISIYNSSFNTHGKNNVYGVYTNGAVNIYDNTNISTFTSNSSTIYDLYSYSGGTISVTPSVVYDELKTSGTISSSTEPSYEIPTLPTEICSNPFVTIPSVTDLEPSAITQTTANLRGEITSDGFSTVTNRGFYYGTSTAYGSTASSTGSYSEGSYSQLITGLTCNTEYHYQIFAENNIGLATTTDATFTTLACPTEQIDVPPSSTHRGPSRSKDKGNIIEAVEEDLRVFTRDLFLGMIGDDVHVLQKYLNSQGFIIATEGVGSIGNETNFFGNLTKQALIKFQMAHNIKPSVGYFGPITRAFIYDFKK